LFSPTISETPLWNTRSEGDPAGCFARMVAAFRYPALNGLAILIELGEGRWHAPIPVFRCALRPPRDGLTQISQGRWYSIALFFSVGFRCWFQFNPCFWAVPTLFAKRVRPRASIGLIIQSEILRRLLLDPLVMGSGLDASKRHAGCGTVAAYMSGILMLAVGGRTSARRFRRHCLHGRAIESGIVFNVSP